MCPRIKINANLGSKRPSWNIGHLHWFQTKPIRFSTRLLMSVLQWSRGLSTHRYLSKLILCMSIRKDHWYKVISVNSCQYPAIPANMDNHNYAHCYPKWITIGTVIKINMENYMHAMNSRTFLMKYSYQRKNQICQRLINRMVILNVFAIATSREWGWQRTAKSFLICLCILRFVFVFFSEVTWMCCIQTQTNGKEPLNNLDVERNSASAPNLDASVKEPSITLPERGQHGRHWKAEFSWGKWKYQLRQVSSQRRLPTL